MDIEHEILKTQLAITETTASFDALVKRILDMSQNMGLLWHGLDRRLEELEDRQRKGGEQ